MNGPVSGLSWSQRAQRTTGMVPRVAVPSGLSQPCGTSVVRRPCCPQRGAAGQVVGQPDVDRATAVLVVHRLTEDGPRSDLTSAMKLLPGSTLNHSRLRSIRPVRRCSP
jgi:hypothetical protein